MAEATSQSHPQYSSDRKSSATNRFTRDKRIERMQKLSARERMALALELGRRLKRGQRGT